MTLSAQFRRPGVLPAAVTAAGVAAAIIAQNIVTDIVGLITYAPYLGSEAWGFSLGYTLALALPIATGMFLSLWLVAPIAGELTIGPVITRAILALGIGVSLFFIVQCVGAIADAVTVRGSILTWMPYFDGATAVSGLGGALTGALRTLVTMLPLGVLAGILLWNWRKSHPSRRPLSGLIDEV